MPSKMNIKKDDTVYVISGKEKGKTGKVLKAMPAEGKVVIEKVNIRIKHKKPRNAQDIGGRIDQEAPIDVSNVMLVCSKCKKPTRVAIEVSGEDKAKIRMCKKCGEAIGK
jgi:large subunit ribosomal protein L24